MADAPELIVTPAPEVVVQVTTSNPPVVQLTATVPPQVVTQYAIGPQGPAGIGAYVHQQTTASTTWTINHNLGYRPSVEVLDSGSQEVDCDIAHPSVNQTVVTLNPASAGLARLI